MGIEPTLSAWKAEVLPLNYTRLSITSIFNWWREKDSNLRRQSRQIYSLIPLAAREPLPKIELMVCHLRTTLMSIHTHHFKYQLKKEGATEKTSGTIHVISSI